MPYKDLEKRREVQRESQARRRARKEPERRKPGPAPAPRPNLPPGIEDYDVAKARKMAAEANLKEIELAKAEAILILKADVSDSLRTAGQEIGSAFQILERDMTLLLPKELHAAFRAVIHKAKLAVGDGISRAFGGGR